MRTTIIAAVLAITSFVSANTSSAQNLDISNVTSIGVNIACNLTIAQGTNPSIKIDGDEQVLAKIETTIRNGKLIIKSDGRNQYKEDISVKVEVKNLDRLTIGGAVNLKSAGMLKFDSFRMSISGVASGEMSLTGNHLDLDCSGVCNLDFAGKYSVLDINVSGVGNINTSKLAARRVSVKNSGVGRVSVLAIDYLNASVSGVGSIRYAGNPEINTSVSGLGRIRKY